MIFKYNGHEPTEVRVEAVPLHYRDLLMPHARKRFAQRSFGTVLSQEISEDGFTLWQHHFFLERPCTFLACNNAALVTVNYMIQGRPYGILPGIGKVVLEEETYQFFYVPPGEHPVSMGKGHYHCLHINLSDTFFRRLAEAYPEMQRLIEAFADDGTSGITSGSGVIDEATKNILDAIGQCRECGPKASIFFQMKVCELILAHIGEVTESEHQDQNIPAKYALAMEGIEDYIKENLNDDLTIATLAGRFNMSESNLRRKFKQFKRKTISEFIREKKLSAGRELLAEGLMTIGEIADKVGYSSVSGFTHAFTKKFKFPPSNMLRG